MRLSVQRHRFLSSGFTLLEITISLALGLIVSISVIQLYSMIKQVALRQKSLVHLQESMQASTFFMGQAIRGAGNMGCIKWQDAQKHIIPPTIQLQAIGLSDNQVIRLLNRESLANGSLSSNVVKHIKPNTDILWIVTSEAVSEKIYKKPGDIMVWADCCDIELFTWTQARGWKNRCQSADNKEIPKKLRKLNSVIYYISDKNELCSVDLNRNAQSHIEGVHDWHIRFDTHNTISIRFCFRHAQAHLTWEQTWFIR